MSLNILRAVYIVEEQKPSKVVFVVRHDKQCITIYQDANVYV